MKKYKMFIDETGREHKSHSSKQYLLLGCIIEATDQHELEIKSNQIKYRYWKRTNIVFHSQEIAKNLNDFTIFEGNDVLKDEFLSDIIQLIYESPLRIVCCVVDKDQAFRIGWNHKTIIHKTADSILLDYLRFIYSRKSPKATGVIVHEASGFEKDAEYLRVFNRVVTPGWTTKHPEFPDIRKHFTSVTFATKLNHDIECEIADILSYAALRKYQARHNIKPLDKGSYDEKLVKVLEHKVLAPAPHKSKDTGIDTATDIVGFCEVPAVKKPTKKKRTA